MWRQATYRNDRNREVDEGDYCENLDCCIKLESHETLQLLSGTLYQRRHVYFFPVESVSRRSPNLQYDSRSIVSSYYFQHKSLLRAHSATFHYGAQFERSRNRAGQITAPKLVYFILLPSSQLECIPAWLSLLPACTKCLLSSYLIGSRASAAPILQSLGNRCTSHRLVLDKDDDNMLVVQRACGFGTRRWLSDQESCLLSSWASDGRRRSQWDRVT